jgi:hypothetical protein
MGDDQSAAETRIARHSNNLEKIGRIRDAYSLRPQKLGLDLDLRVYLTTKQF